jgi:hypothetical protein
MSIKISIDKDIFTKAIEIPLNFDILCSICGSELNEKESPDDYHILDCNHKFHYSCLIKFLENDNSRNRYNYCPYCREKFDFLPLKDKIKPIKYIHAEYYHKKNNLDNIQENKANTHLCSAIKKDGSPCKKHINIMMKYCNIHDKKQQN